MPASFFEKLKKDPQWEGQLVRVETLPGQDAVYDIPKKALDPEIVAHLEAKGLRRLYSHQAKALDAVDSGKHVTVVTPTASGKTLTYILPVMRTLLADENAKALMLFPIKALAQDQLVGLGEWYEAVIRPGRGGDPKKEPGAEIYDGDTSAYRRGKIRGNPPPMILSNPDMLHLGMLPYHASWGKFLGQLRYVVVDEAHTYRGIFGAHVSMVLRRLRRLCRFYGSEPQFIFLSATVANAAEFSERLLGETTEVVDENGAPAGKKYVGLWNSVASPYRESTHLFTQMVRSGLKTIAFTKARKIAELMSLWTGQGDPDLKGRIAAYRAGYLPEERRDIERRLFDEKLDGVISTSALEMGIDVGALDACLLVGYPGTMISTWQRAGRVGRRGKESLVLLVGLQDAMDQYFIRHPDVFFSRPVENALIPIDNPVIAGSHLICAAAEHPLEEGDWELLGKSAKSLADSMWRRGEIQKGAQGHYFSPGKRPQRDVNIRSTGNSFVVEAPDRGKGWKTIARMEVPRVYRDCHPGAIYLHQTLQYRVTELDENLKRVRVEAVETDHYTEPRGDDDVEILEVLQRRNLGHVEWCYGRVQATEQITGYVSKQVQSQKVLSEYSLEMPPHRFETRASWFVLPSEWRKEFASLGYDFAGSIHALEHAQIAMLPLMVLCDRWDLGGVSYWAQPQLDQPAIFVYDGYAGGAALAEKGYEVVDEWLRQVERLLSGCDCEPEGCPACVQSPKCGNGNKPLDRLGALELCRRLLARLDQDKEKSTSGSSPVVKEEKPETLLPRNTSTAGAASEAEAAGGSLLSKSLDPEKDDIVFFDLETQFLADEVGGWDRKADMKVSVGVTWSTKEKRFRQYTEGQIQELLKQLFNAKMVVGFNNLGFDNEVLQPYSSRPMSELPSLDLLAEITRTLGHRLRLDSVAQSTLNQAKQGDGKEAVTLWRDGKLAALLEYCQKDVELTRDLWLFGRQYGYLLYEKRGQGLMRIAVDW